MTASVKSLAVQGWVLRLLEEGPLSAGEISERMWHEIREEWAEENGVADLIEWGNRESEPLGARLLAASRARQNGSTPLHQWELRPHLIRMEKHGLVERIVIEGHRPMLWRASNQDKRLKP